MGLQKTLQREDSRIYHTIENAYWVIGDVQIKVDTNTVDYTLRCYPTRDASKKDEYVYHCSFDDPSMPDIGRSAWLYIGMRSVNLDMLNIEGSFNTETVKTAIYQYLKNNVEYFTDATDVLEEETA